MRNTRTILALGLFGRIDPASGVRSAPQTYCSAPQRLKRAGLDPSCEAKRVGREVLT